MELFKKRKHRLQRKFLKHLEFHLQRNISGVTGFMCPVYFVWRKELSLFDRALIADAELENFLPELKELRATDESAPSWFLYNIDRISAVSILLETKFKKQKHT